MESTVLLLAWNLVAAFALMLCVWPFSVIKKDVSIVDIFWGLGFVLVAWNTFFHAQGYLARQLLVTLLTTLWGFRLALHIFARSIGKGEDRRYQAFRANIGRHYWSVSLFTVFGLQAFLLWIVVLPVQIAQISPTPDHLVWSDFLGVIIWLVGFIFESVGDWQLFRFKKDPANEGKVMDRGLWAYTRHPNYFGEALIWWGMFLIAMASPTNVWVIVSPVLITVLLLKVSGVSLLEKTIVETRPEYRDYIKRTNAFLPWIPKRKHH